ncbi:DUF6289 family protein [Nonomuraea angiospora]|uniref:DUF6289 family protein n=1 Tax=Nonomuraea angiospora TaxID=46172 RepID=UPI0037B4C121
MGLGGRRRGFPGPTPCHFLAAPAHASVCKPHYTCSTTYHSDAAQTEVVGRYTVDCKGRVYETGTRSDHSAYSSYICGPAAE